MNNIVKFLECYGSSEERSSPNGRIIGKVPNGWAVVTGKRDSTGRWIYIDEYPTASAPYLRRGWVSTAFLKHLGRFCEKPVSFMHSDMNGLFGSKKTPINEDWVQIGDRISKAIPKK